MEQNFNDDLYFELQKLKEKHDSSPDIANPVETLPDIAQLEQELLNIDYEAAKMQLLIKNNLTIIQSIDLSGHGTSALMELVDIQKDFVIG